MGKALSIVQALTLLAAIAPRLSLRLLRHLCTVLCLAAVVVGQARPSRPSTVSARYRPDRVLVRFRSGTSSAMAEAINRGAGTFALRNLRSVPGLAVVKLSSGIDVQQALRAYRRQPGVLYAEPDFLVHVASTPNDPYFSDLWNMRKIQAPQAWDLTTGSPTVVVGVIDTGLDYTHPDLAANVYRNVADCNYNGVDDDGDGYIDDCYGIDTANADSDPMDDHGHGTHVSGTIGAVGNNATGVVGVNWNVRLFPCKALDATGSGSISTVLECLDYFAWQKDHGVNLVATSNSWGGGGFSQALMDAIDQQRVRDMLFIAAAGNDGWNTDYWYKTLPADYDLPNIISVAATDSLDQLPKWSDKGRITVDLGAPGVSILSTIPGNSYGYDSGTSMATPHVTGVVALLKAQNPALPWQAVKNLILTGTDPVPALADSTLSGGRLNAYNALTCSNRILERRMQPYTTLASVPPGQPLTLALLGLNCDHPNTAEQVTVLETGEVIALHDDGVAPDTIAGDGIFYGQFSATALGAYTLQFPGGDTVTVNVAPGYAFAPTTYSWRTITGTNLYLGPDYDSLEIALPFPIQFAGTQQNALFVNEVGTISFGAAMDTWAVPPYPVDAPMPSGIPVAFVAPYWDDLFPLNFVTDDGNVFYDVVGTAPNRELVIEFRNVGLSPCGGAWGTARVHFQVVFSEATSDVIFNYADVDLDSDTCWQDMTDGVNATVGVQLSSDTATEYSFKRRSLSNNLALRWTLVGENPVPALTSLLPGHGVTNSGAFNLVVSGTGLVFGSQILWNGSSQPTTVVSSTQVQAAIPAADVVNPGTATISLTSPGPGGGVSNSLDFVIVTPPTTAAVSPTSAAAGTSAFNLSVNGANFVSGDVVLWNGTPMPTTFISSTELDAAIPSTDVIAVGSDSVSVIDMWGDASNPAMFTVLAPSLANISPPFMPAGSSAFVLSVTGANFVPGSTLVWGGVDEPTTFVDGSDLTAAIPASAVAAIGSSAVTVRNPGGSLTSATSFSITGPVPASLWPTSLSGGGGPSTISVFGNGFLSTDVVRWNGAAQNTTYLSSSQLNVDVSAADVATTGSVAITVQNAEGYVSIPLTVVVSDYIATVSPASSSVTAGQPATYTVSVSNQYAAFTNLVTLSCSVPAGFGTCSFSPPNVVPGSGTVTSTLTVQTTATTASSSGSFWHVPTFAALFLFPLGFSIVRRKRIVWRLFALLLITIAVVGFVSCGGGSSAFSSTPPAATNPRNGTITVTATSGALQHTTSAALTVR